MLHQCAEVWVLLRVTDHRALGEISICVKELLCYRTFSYLPRFPKFLILKSAKSHHKSESVARLEVQTLTFSLTFSPCISVSMKVPWIICHLHSLSTSTKCGGYLYDVTAAFHINPEIEITSTLLLLRPYFPLIRGMFVYRSGLRFSFRALEVPKPRGRKRPI